MFQFAHHQQLADIKEDSSETCLALYLLATDQKRPFVLVLPGGGYHHLAAHEGAPVAEWLNSLGYHAGVLYYQTENYQSLLSDIESTLATLKDHASTWKIQPNAIGAIGFSAGGHLAATIGTHFKGLNFLLLAYPVITFREPYVHLGSRQQLLGDNPSPELINWFSNECHVSETTPATFIWHTANDATVSVQNSLLFVEALISQQISVAYHLLPEGRHGLGLAKGTPCQIWTTLAESWLKEITTALRKELA
ncbi:alpha/beta hydrolase [Vagococcus sp. BWB3-3]|uniref:Alpha/beta hydrolase n=1 Tax=Vagococcus allomyrinae TaxID=2794353 RepID=A0A940P9T4_9ENTE|nr:alpha/beta hydrolase [Vagococcus allomyrinae]MBP1043957.1 alpha/beta hydrolase [Vagococcus allomyrinae]